MTNSRARGVHSPILAVVMTRPDPMTERKRLRLTGLSAVLGLISQIFAVLASARTEAIHWFSGALIVVFAVVIGIVLPALHKLGDV